MIQVVLNKRDVVPCADFKMILQPYPQRVEYGGKYGYRPYEKIVSTMWENRIKNEKYVFGQVGDPAAAPRLGEVGS